MRAPSHRESKSEAWSAVADGRVALHPDEDMARGDRLERREDPHRGLNETARRTRRTTTPRTGKAGADNSVIAVPMLRWQASARPRCSRRVRAGGLDRSQRAGCKDYAAAVRAVVDERRPRCRSSSAGRRGKPRRPGARFDIVVKQGEWPDRHSPLEGGGRILIERGAPRCAPLRCFSPLLSASIEEPSCNGLRPMTQAMRAHDEQHLRHRDRPGLRTCRRRP